MSKMPQSSPPMRAITARQTCGRWQKFKVDALIVDNGMRSRDERFAGHARDKDQPDPLYDKSHTLKPARLYQPEDFDYDPGRGSCICPAGKTLYRNGSNCLFTGYAAVTFQGA